MTRSSPGRLTLDKKPASVAAIAGEAEADNAIATLVLAFSSDPVARWIYDDPHQYLLHIPRLFRALGTSSFEAAGAQRTSDGLGVALWLPPGVHGDDGPLEAVIAESIAREKQADVGAAFERTEHYRPTEPHWYLSLIGVEALHIRSWGHNTYLPSSRSAFGLTPAFLPAEALLDSRRFLRCAT